MTIDRRSFFKVAGAAALGTQLSGFSSAVKAAQPDRIAVDGNYKYDLKPTISILHCRRVLFFTKEDPKTIQLPPVGTVISSPDGMYCFIVPEQASILPIVPHITTEWDEEHFDVMPGVTYDGVSMVVEPIAPGLKYALCPIRKVLTPSIGKDWLVCEDWRHELVGVPEGEDIWKPRPGFAFDALYPDYLKQQTEEILNSTLVFDHSSDSVYLKKP